MKELPVGAVPAIKDDFILEIKKGNKMVKFLNAGLTFYVQSLHDEAFYEYHVCPHHTIDYLMQELLPWFDASRIWVNKDVTQYSRSKTIV